MAETREQGEAAVATWQTVRQVEYPYYWLALFPLMGAALQKGEIAAAVECVKHLLIPPQQRLPDDLTELLARTEAVWEKDLASEAEDLLQRAFHLAQVYHYV